MATIICEAILTANYNQKNMFNCLEIDSFWQIRIPIYTPEPIMTLNSSFLDIHPILVKIWNSLIRGLLLVSLNQLGQWFVTPFLPCKKFCGQEGQGEGAEHEVARRQRHDERRRHVVSCPVKTRTLGTYLLNFFMATLNPKPISKVGI